MQPQIRAGLLVNLRPTVDRLSGDINEVLALAGLDSDVLLNPDDFVPYRSYLKLLNAAAVVTDCSHFGLLMSQTLGAENMGVAGFVMSQAANVGAAWASLQRFYHVHDTYGIVTITESEDTACVRYEIPKYNLPGVRQSLDVAAGVAINIHRALAGHDTPVSSFHFPYPEPADCGPYEFLGCSNLNFERPGFGMFFSSDLLHLPVTHSDPQMQEILQNYLESLETGSAHATSRKVERLIRDFLSTGNCTLSHIAKFLSISVRALQNKLEAEHTSFQFLLDKVRRELALLHLSKGDIQVTQLAYLLGYSELSAFSRSFKRWYGTSPRNWQHSQEPSV